MTSVGTLSPNQVTFLRYWGARTLTPFFGGHNSTHSGTQGPRKVKLRFQAKSLCSLQSPCHCLTFASESEKQCLRIIYSHLQIGRWSFRQGLRKIQVMWQVHGCAETGLGPHTLNLVHIAPSGLHHRSVHTAAEPPVPIPSASSHPRFEKAVAALSQGDKWP